MSFKTTQIELDSVAALKAYPLVNGAQQIKLRGFSSAGDGGHGDYYWDSTSTATTYLGAVIQSNYSTVGRWLLLHNGEVNVHQFGATGNGSTDDILAIQSAIDFAIYSGNPVSRIRFLADKSYSISDSIFIANFNGSSYSLVSNLTIDGQQSISIDVSGSTPRIVPTFSDKPAIVCQLVKGLIIKGLSFEGKNIGTATSSNLDSLHTDANFLKNDGSIRSNRYSPYAAIVLDAYSSSTASGNQYPGQSARYVGTGGGFNRVTIECCMIQYFCVGILASATTGVDNGEDFVVRDCSIASCDTAIAYGQSQLRGASVQDCYFDTIRIGINCVDYGEGNGAMPNVINGVWIYIQKVFSLAPQSGGGIISGLYTEQTISLGVLGTANASVGMPVVFNGCHFDFNYRTITPNYHILTSYSMVVFTGCVFQTYSLMPLLVYFPSSRTDHPLLKFDSCQFYNPSVGGNPFWIYSNDYSKTRFTNCRINGAMIYDETIPVTSWSSINGKYVMPGSQVKVGGRNYQISANLPTMTSFNPVSFSITDSGKCFIQYGASFQNNFQSGDLGINIANNATWINTSGITYNFVGTYVGLVTGVTPGASGTISLRNLPKDLGLGSGTVGASGYAFSGMTVNWFPKIHDSTYGSTTFASTTISNVSNPSAWSTGDRIRGLGIVDGAYISGISGSTFYITQTATATHPRNALYDAFYTPIFTDELNYRVGFNSRTLDSNDQFIGATAVGVTYTLPSVNTIPRGKFFLIKDVSGLATGNSAVITITGQSNQLIDGAANYKISGAYGSVKILSDGTTGWSIF